MLNTLVILAALFGSVFGGALVLPALGRWQVSGVLLLWPLGLGTALVCLAGAAALYGVSRYRGTRGRKLIAVGIIAAGGFYMVPLLQAFFLPKAGVGGWVFCALLAVASLSFYGSCYRLNHRLASAPVSGR
jgi:hypothetical protein